MTPRPPYRRPPSIAGRPRDPIGERRSIGGPHGGGGSGRGSGGPGDPLERGRALGPERGTRLSLLPTRGPTPFIFLFCF